MRFLYLRRTNWPGWLNILTLVHDRFVRLVVKRVLLTFSSRSKLRRPGWSQGNVIWWKPKRTCTTSGTKVSPKGTPGCFSTCYDTQQLRIDFCEIISNPANFHRYFFFVVVSLRFLQTYRRYCKFTVSSCKSFVRTHMFVARFPFKNNPGRCQLIHRIFLRYHSGETESLVDLQFFKKKRHGGKGQRKRRIKKVRGNPIGAADPLPPLGTP